MLANSAKHPSVRHAPRRSATILLAVAMVAAFAIASFQIASHTGSSSQGSAVHPAPGQQVGPGYRPPSSIDANCQSDATNELADWLYSLPQGTRTNPTVVQFAPDACYEVDGSMFLRDFRYFVFNGNGATFDQTHVRTGPEINLHGANRPAYCGSNAYEDASQTDFLNYRHNAYVDIMFFVEGGCNITFENMKFLGTNHGPGGGPLEQDTFITFGGTQDALVNNVTMTNPYGDYVDTQALHEAPGGVEWAYEASNITVENSSFSGAGRQGIGIVLANRVNVEYNHFYSAAATMFDIEWDSTGGKQSDISIAHNTIVGQDYAFLVSAQTGALLQRFEFADNRLIYGAQLRIFILPAFGSSDVRVTGNVATMPATWTTRANVTIKHVTRSEVDHNSTPVGWWRPGDGNGGPFVIAPGGLVRNNTLRGLQIYRLKGSLVVQEYATSCSNTTPGGQEIGGSPCTGKLSYPTVVAPATAVLPRY